MGHWKNRWIQTPQRILMDPCIKLAPVLSKRFWIILWPLAYNRLELDCIRKIINFWYTFGWKWRVFVTIWDCRTHVRMTSMTSSVERTDLDFKISVALDKAVIQHVKGVKKVRSAVHQRIWKYAGQILAEYFAFSIHRWSSVILYNVWNQSCHWMNSQSYIFLWYCLSDVLKNLLFSKYLWYVRHLGSF